MKDFTGKKLAFEIFKGKIRNASPEILVSPDYQKKLFNELCADTDFFNRLIDKQKNMPFDLRWLESSDDQGTAKNISKFVDNIDQIPGYELFWKGWRDFFWRETGKAILKSILGYVVTEKSPEQRNWYEVIELLNSGVKNTQNICSNVDPNKPTMHTVPLWINSSDNTQAKAISLLNESLGIRERFEEEIEEYIEKRDRKPGENVTDPETKVTEEHYPEIDLSDDPYFQSQVFLSDIYDEVIGSYDGTEEEKEDSPETVTDKEEE